MIVGLSMTPAESAAEAVRQAEAVAAETRAAMTSETGRRLLATYIQEHGTLEPGVTPADVQQFITTGPSEKPAVSSLFGSSTLWIVGGVVVLFFMMGRRK